VGSAREFGQKGEAQKSTKREAKRGEHQRDSGQLGLSLLIWTTKEQRKEKKVKGILENESFRGKGPGT